MLLIDFWEELAKTHQLKVDTEHDAWAKSTCWVYYRPTCSCGHVHPNHSRTSMEHRPEIGVQIQADHFKHLVQELLEQKGDIDT